MLRYSSKRVHKPTEFFTKALSNSSTLCLGLGYFSSACFNVLACGFAHFVRNGGNMRMYINPHVTEDDYNMLRNKDHDGIEASMLQSYYRHSHVVTNFSLNACPTLFRKIGLR